MDSLLLVWPFILFLLLLWRLHVLLQAFHLIISSQRIVLMFSEFLELSPTIFRHLAKASEKSRSHSPLGTGHMLIWLALIQNNTVIEKCWCFIGSGFLRVVVVSILKYELSVKKLYLFSYSCEWKNQTSPHDAPRTSLVLVLDVKGCL